MNFRDKHNAKLAAGHRINVPHKHDLGVIDPREQFANAPPYPMGEGLLPQYYEDYVQNNIAEFGGDPAAYACAFLAVHCGVLHSSVQMQTRPRRDVWKSPNDHSLTLGASGSNKSGTFNDLTKHQEAWQFALDKGVASGKRRGPPPVRIYSQGGSVEGVLKRIGDNNGERLLIGNDEAMQFYMGTGAHHQGAGASMMTDTVCRMYDGKSYSKDLVDAKRSFHIAKCLGTMVMTTVFEKFSGWDGFEVMVQSGAMARTTVGVVSNVMKRDERLFIEGADARMEAALLKLRSMRHVRFALAPEVHQAWSDFIDAKEERNAEMGSLRESEGYAYWCKKYDMRIMSMATIFQAIDWTASEKTMMAFEPFDVPQSEDKVGGGEPEQGKLVRITYENLDRAINFVEGFLSQTQEHFYGIASGVTEFGPELLNWVAHRATAHSIDTPDNNVLTRTDLVHRGPACVRPGKGGATDAWRRKADRWVRALLDCGYIEVYRGKEGARNTRAFKTEEQEANYRLRDEFFEKFADEATRLQFKDHDGTLQKKIKEGFQRGPLGLRKQGTSVIGEQGIEQEPHQFPHGADPVGKQDEGNDSQ